MTHPNEYVQGAFEICEIVAKLCRNESSINEGIVMEREQNFNLQRFPFDSIKLIWSKACGFQNYFISGSDH